MEVHDNNFYGVLDEVLDIQYPMGRHVWLFKCRWFDINSNKSQRTLMELRHHMNKHIKNDTLCMPDIDPAMVGRSVVRTMSSFPSTFKKTDARFLEFDDKFNNVEGSFLVSDNSDRTKPSPTPKRR
ncbi:cytochrome P450 CYP82D47-like [Cucumis melo var. makuwa]|uniref:Cytochrome P450 CYP82D47-like n=1 Tax=Cucumis melo var. makuwa TaxID=1194695 RepID=A0A5D3CRC4_CUCMM|nr:cytochrome P450 CYP82D47-like [Cucumis melo var. makuwa]